METQKKYDSYWYHIEDGQFSKDFEKDTLLGDEGDIIKVFLDGDEPDEIYILFIDGDYVACVGNVESSFPINWNEHMELRKTMQALYQKHDLG